MAKKILVAYDFNLNEIQNVKAHIVAGDPGAPVEGQFWYNSVSKRLKWRNDAATIDPLERANHAGTQSADTITDGATNKAYTATEKTKLAGIATGATANDTDANLKNRANHTGTQSADTITDGATNKAYTATEKTKLAGIATGATANDSDANLKNRANHTGSQLAATISDFADTVRGVVLTGLSTATNAAIAAGDSILAALGKLQAQINGHFGAGGAAHADVVAGGASGFMTGAQATKLAGIANGATANSSDATLLARGNHTGTQAASTISDFDTAVDARVALVIDAAPEAMNTLNELAAALGDDPNFASSINTALGERAKKYAATIGNDAATSIAVVHNLNTQDVIVSVRETATQAGVECDWVATNTTTVTLNFATAPATDSLRVVVHG